MNKEQILKTLDTKVSDGTITEILRSIVNSIPQGGNEPLIVEGESLSGNFTVTDGTSLEYLGQEFKKGRLILLRDVSNFDYEVVTEYVSADGALHTKNYSLEIE